jgi:hypothetical protein
MAHEPALARSLCEALPSDPTGPSVLLCVSVPPW